MKTLLLYSFILILFITSCGKDLPAPINDEELITTLRLEFISQNPTETKIIQFQDLDGDGGNPPVYQADTLRANTNYTCRLYVLNESVNPPSAINQEILEEGIDHQFFFLEQNGLNLNITYNDLDGNQNPIGLINYAITQGASEGNLTVILRHQGDKFATGASIGDISNVGGSTDIEVVFEVVIE
jgi:hypothetical protein